MKRARILFLSIILVIGIVMLVFLNKEKQMKKEENNGGNEVTTGYNIYKYLTLEFNDKNIIYSPLSIESAFSMLKEGSSGATYEELNKLFNKEKFKQYELTDKLSIANAIFINNDFKDYVKEDYINAIEEKYNAEVKYDDFINPDNINNWVYEKTLNLIDKILDEVDNQMKIVLVNALAIDIEWVDKFESTSTRGEDFTLIDGTKYLATTMHNVYSSNASYYKDDNIQAVSIDLRKEGNANFEFIAIMPNDITKYIKNINEEEVNKVINKLVEANNDKRLNLSIPKFKFDYSLKLKDDLDKLGLKRVFTPEAELDKIGPNLYVSDALHKANIEFSEEGIKAAAVTAIILKNSAMIPEYETVEINLNKPFVFIIRDKETKDIWFVGTLLKPNSWDDDKEEYNKEITF